MDVLKYKDYEGTAEVDMTRMVCRGKVLFINDLVTYEAASPAELKNEFETAVDDYLETCAALGREPKKPLKGQFNVRVPESLHKAATLRALAEGVSLNDVVVRAMDVLLNAKTDVNHNVKVSVEINTDSMQTLISSASVKDPQWGVVSNASH